MSSPVCSLTSSPAARRGFSVSAALLLSSVLIGGSGCNRTSGTSAAKDDLHMIPKETDVVFMVNVKQARKSPLWDKFVEKFNQDAIGKKGVVLASGDWVKRAIDLDAGKGENATKNGPLVDMIKRTKTSDSLWWAGMVPAQVSERLGSNPQLQPVRSLRSVSGSIEIVKGLDLHAVLDLGSDGEAAQLKDKATEQLTGLRNLPALKMIGMVGFLDTVKVSSQKSSFVIDVSMNQQQVDDLMNRLSGLAQQMR